MQLPKTKVEVYDKDQLIYPFIESDHVIFSNGMKITEMLDQSISMPKVTHEDSSFKVGVGDQDVSSAIVDSSVADMTIKGQTYQNVLPEPSLRNKMIGKSMQRLNEGYDNIEVVDGVSKSAILKGQTLVNLVVNSNIEKTVGKSSGTEAKYDYIQPLENNKEYTLQFEISNFNAIQPMSCSFDNGWNTINDITIDKNGIYKTKFTIMNRESTQIWFYWSTPQWDDGNSATVKNIIILEGDHTQEDIPYFEGMQSVKMPILKTVGKNLFNTNSFTGEFYPNNSYITVDFPPSDNNTFSLAYKRSSGTTTSYVEFEVRVLPNKKYFFSYNKTSLNNDPNLSRRFSRYAFVINNTKESLKYVKFSKNNGGLITTPSNCTSLMIRMYTTQGSCLTAGDTITLSEIQLEEVTEGVEEASPFEPYKTNILTANEDVTLRGIGDVRDELDCLTGEVTERIKKFDFLATDDGNWYYHKNENGYTSYYISNKALTSKNNGICDKLPICTWSGDAENIDKECIWVNGATSWGAMIKSDKASTKQDFLNYLNDNVELLLISKTESIKTVDLSSHGNWEKIVLDGSDNYTWGIADKTTFWQCKCENAITNMREGALCFGQGDKSIEYTNTAPNKPYQVHINAQPRMIFTLPKSAFKDSSEFKQHLQQNPVTVWYQTTTTQDNSIREMLSFANGHLQVSSEAENSLLPFVQYEIPTKNSYHMDLMKANTLYTMKAKTVSGTFTIDGTSYNVNANGTFTSPSSMTDKLLIMNNKTNEEVMLLEGNVIDKTIPYFKGIKSAFEDEDKIEVLSTGKNLFDNSRVNNYLAEYLDNGYVKATGGKQGDIFAEQKAKPFIKPNTKYTITVDIVENTMIGLFEVQYNGDRRASLKTSFYIDSGFVGKISKTCDSKEVIENELVLVPKVIAQNTSGHVIFRIIVEESSIPTSYEPHKSNSTKIPLLSPLRSLPNGVCDELIINRMKKKATLIQRIKTVTLDGSSDERWAGYNDDSARVTQGFYHNVSDLVIARANVNLYCDTLQPNINAIHSRDGRGVGTHNDGSNNRNIRLCLLKNELIPYGFSEPLKTNENVLRKWLQDNPTTVLYELATPIITEIDLEGYPYAYKDGHIFLNSDIAPTTQITYSINQAQQIESANENLQRHEKEISRLQKLIAQYIQVEYVSTLLSLKV